LQHCWKSILTPIVDDDDDSTTSADHRLVVLDEVTSPINRGWIDVEEVVATVSGRPDHVSMVITGRHRPALAGHAAFEVFSMLTRMPGQAAVDSLTAEELIRRAFPERVWLSEEATGSLFVRLGTLGITGGEADGADVRLSRRGARRPVERGLLCHFSRRVDPPG
jgi:hypothetical protein